jgi:hypothetical protein
VDEIYFEPVAQMIGFVSSWHVAIVPSVHFLDPTSEISMILVSMPDASLMIVCDSKLSFGVLPSSHLTRSVEKHIGKMLTAHKPAVPASSVL